MQLINNVVRRAFGALGLEIIRKSTHRGISLETDLRRLIGDGPHTFIDAGANIGDVSAQLLHSFPYARVYAFEPVPATFAKLSERAASDSRIAPVRAALGDAPGVAKMEVESTEGLSRITSNGADNTISVEVKTVDQFCEEQRLTKLDLLKTDCEGYDNKVVRGADALLSRGCIKAVYCEVNFRRDGGHGDFFDLHDYLTSRDMAFYALYDYSGLAGPLHANFANALWIRPS